MCGVALWDMKWCGSGGYEMERFRVCNNTILQRRLTTGNRQPLIQCGNQGAILYGL